MAAALTGASGALAKEAVESRAWNWPLAGAVPRPEETIPVGPAVIQSVRSWLSKPSLKTAPVQLPKRLLVLRLLHSLSQFQYQMGLLLTEFWLTILTQILSI